MTTVTKTNKETGFSESFTFNDLTEAENFVRDILHITDISWHSCWTTAGRVVENKDHSMVCVITTI